MNIHSQDGAKNIGILISKLTLECLGGESAPCVPHCRASTAAVYGGSTPYLPGVVLDQIYQLGVAAEGESGRFLAGLNFRNWPKAAPIRTGRNGSACPLSSTAGTTGTFSTLTSVKLIR